MKTKLTVIIDNTPSENLSGEWGLSILVEHRGHIILADAGRSELFAENLETLGFDIRDVEYATLSHAHYDHANGMPRFFRDNDKACFYLRETTGENCYAKKGLFKKYIGIPRHVMSDYSDRIRIVSGDYELFEGAYLIPHKTPGLESVGKREKMYKRIGHRMVFDDFSHEQSLVLDTDKGIIIINCCSHGGAVNIINEIKETFPDKHVYGLIGGLHLFNKTDEEVSAVARAILGTGIDFVCTGHCTKDRAYDIMAEELGDRLHKLKVGLVMEF